MSDGRVDNGGARRNAGRTPKAIQDALKESLKPFEEGFFEAMQEGIKKKDFKWCQMYAAYMYGKPKETKDIDLTSGGEPLQQITGITVE